MKNYFSAWTQITYDQTETKKLGNNSLKISDCKFKKCNRRRLIQMPPGSVSNLGKLPD